MKRVITLLPLVAVLLTATSVFGQEKEVRKTNPYAVGIGFDVDGSLGAVNIGVPLELRIGRVTDPFTLHIGERISYHTGGDSSEVYWDTYYNMYLCMPTVSFTQFSTYVLGRWNAYRDKDFFAFVGAGYYFNLNTRGTVNIDIPNVSYIGGFHYTYNDELRRFWCSDMLNPVSHSLRFELGCGMPLFDFTIFMSVDLTGNFDRNVVRNELYFDRNCVERDMLPQPVSAPGSSYTAINLASIKDIDNATRDRVFFGVGLKFYLFSGYLK